MNSSDQIKKNKSIFRLPLFSYIQHGHRLILWLALLWTAINSFQLYVVRHGVQVFRLESAFFILILLMLPLLLRRERQTLADIELTSIQLNLIVVLVVGLWLFTFIPLLNFPFLCDDYVFLKWYKPFWSGSGTPQFFRPLYNLFFWFLAKIGGGSPLIFHAASLSLHLGSSVLVYSLVYRFQKSRACAVICFAIFLLNPLQLEATLWVSGLQELLWTFFILAALRCHIGTRELSVRRLVATVIFITGALLCKETAVCILLLLPLFDLAYFKMKRGPYLMAAYISVIILLSAYLLLWRTFALSPSAGFFSMPSLYFVKQFLSTPYRFFAHPWNEVAVKMPAWIPVIVTLSIAGLLFVAVVYRRASIRLLFGPLIIIISTLPVFKGFFVRADLLATRYIYFAAFGWALFITHLLGVMKIRKLVLPIAISTALLLTWTLHLNMTPWRTAGHIVQSIHTGIDLGNDPQYIISEWKKQKGQSLEIKNGVPYQYQGVGIFITGYPEMLQLINSGFFGK